ncbi:hypothetical protein SEA_CAPTAINREX_59 [Microbacterium phage CaptainRex]|nr:hypothetical protein SEA_HASITHA_59 [Microbacterium phage Hasitha]UVK59216.1 hypothetical protein SEA_LIBRIE_59 [Microbacterium phage Librie]WIC89889.1 hypothetical protein SEA_CAPTAINREX_59 [Microbacterium phage CaptainRex]
MSLYECKVPNEDKWVECSVNGCARERRINKNMDAVLRLEQYKLKLEAGQQLSDMEQQDLEEIAAHVKAVVESFISALQEAFTPIIESITTALKDLWDSLPESMKVELLKEAEPRLEFKLGDVATPYSEAQSRVFGLSAYDMPTIQQRRNLS